MTSTIRFFIFSILYISLVEGAIAQSQSKVEQLSDSQVKAFYERAKASGMSEMQIEQAALAQGFTLSDISLMRKRITQIQDKEDKTDSDGMDTLQVPSHKI